MEPTSTLVQANGIDHHVLTWNAGGAPTVVLAHGFLDFGWSWRRVAEGLAARGMCAIAFDWRGHGESSWIGAGGYYHFADYVLDLEELLPKLAEGAVHLVGHSMGGTAAALYAGTRPDRIRSLTLVEGLGPPAHDAAVMPDRFGAFLRTVHKVRSAPADALLSLEDAAARLRAQHPSLDDDFACWLAERGTRVDGAGARHWRFDPLHRTTSPVPFQLEGFRAFLARVEAPTLYVAAANGYRLPDEGERLRALARLRVLELGEVGHMIHWFAPDALAAAIADHVAGA